MLLKDGVFFNVPKILDDRGNLSFFQYPDQIPFEISGLYWINDIPGGTSLPGLANLASQEVIVALSGSFDVLVHDGNEEKKYTLNRPDHCLYLPVLTWRAFVNFSTNSVAFVVSDKEYSKAGQISDFGQFQLVKNDETAIHGF